MNSKQQEILDILQEEAAEVIQAISKVRRFGLQNNIEELNKELADLSYMIELAKTYVPEIGQFNFAAGEKRKYDRLVQYSNIFKDEESLS